MFEILHPCTLQKQTFIMNHDARHKYYPAISFPTATLGMLFLCLPASYHVPLLLWEVHSTPRLQAEALLQGRAGPLTEVKVLGDFLQEPCALIC